MPRDLFGDVTRPSISIGNRKWYTVPVSLVSHTAVVAAIVAIPLLAPALMPKVTADSMPPVPIMPIIPPPPPLPDKRPPIKPVENRDAAPTSAPEGFTPENKEPVLDAGFEGTSTVIGDAFNNFDSHVGGGPPPPSPPPQPMRVGGVIRTPQKTHHVDPVYPQMAILSRTQGVVIIEATIGADGRILDARTLRADKLLEQAALDAVRQWQYTPSLLNGVPVPVIMTVTVIFTLSK